MGISKGETQSLRVLLDTNIVVDVALERQPFYIVSMQVLTFAYRGEIEAFISASTVSDIYYIVRKAKGHDATLEFLQIIAPFCRIATVDQIVISNALVSSFRDFEDAVQYECAIANQLAAIVTRNPQDFPGNGLQILKPETLIQQLSQSNDRLP
jgi:predicted nucleic acid-binding protein